MATTDRILELVQTALDELDERPIDVSARRVARIASLLGDTKLALRLGLELKTTGGHPAGNAEDTRRLMADPSMWGAPGSPFEVAFEEYCASRTIGTYGGMQGDGHIASHSLAEMEFLLHGYDEHEDEFSAADPQEWMSTRQEMSAAIERVRHTMFTALCAWERQLSYANVNERIFNRFRSNVDALLAAGAPEVLDSFAAVYRRLRDVGAAADVQVTDELSQAVTTCRRILKAVADHVYPPQHGAVSPDGVKLDDSTYRNRIRQFLAERVDSTTYREAMTAPVSGLFERFSATDKLASKGVHATLALEEAEMCAISTYILAGELLRLSQDQARADDANAPASAPTEA